MNSFSLADNKFDFVVVGGGSAGCVMASRLSEDSASRVLLIEAGQDLSKGVELPAISDPGARTIFKPELFWPDFFGQGNAASEKAPERHIPIMQARLLGGGSSINGMHAQRGFPRDYDEWASLGLTDWGWEDVLPYFKKLEADRDFSGPMHGTDGPIPISRMGREQWGPLSRAVESELRNTGLGAQSDLNAEFNDGVGPVPLNISPTTRVSSARGYLTPEVRSRPNLTILTGTEVAKILLESGRVVGVSVRTDQGLRDIAAREVVVTCGAIHTPALLQRSGIGPGSVLQQLGVPVLVDRQGVGRNLSNHPMMSMNAHLRHKGRRKNTDAPPCMMVARYSSNVADCPPTDMILNLWERVTSPHVHDPLGRQIADFMFILNKPFSRGDVIASGENLMGRPQVRFNMFEDERDLVRMVDAFRYGAAIMKSPTVKPLINSSFLLNFTPLLFAYLSDTPKGRLLSKLGGVGLGTSDLLGKAVLRRMTTPLETLPSDDEGLTKLVRSITLMGGHPTGTCRLGRPDDPDAVVDNRGRVLGVDGLRVADASIFPSVMAAGTNLPTMMAAEKIASHIVHQHN
ncbi:MAG TPA: GMC family oxidoreductase N-terminal domain-containing protein [Phenylobacterium sp.]|nr:GMC family oxidoreductase N-terminal domain-containing protein [Phenylobacterium sp.]HKR87922.1 GMC family oxidoreductase N-terminal domain-containing protein [Phenylobacterium sp.]